MIGSAIERGSLICVFDEHGHTLFPKARGSGAKDGLLGFTVPPSPCGAGHLHVRRTRHDDLLKGGVTDCIILGGLSRRRCA